MHGKILNAFFFFFFFDSILFCMHLFHKIHDGRADNVWSVFALFACTIVSEKLAYEILGHLSYSVRKRKLSYYQNNSTNTN